MEGGGVPLLKIKLEAETLGLGRVWTSGLGGGKPLPNNLLLFPETAAFIVGLTQQLGW